MLKNNIKSELFLMIERDENIIWAGKPNILCFILEAIFNPFLVFAILWGCCDFAFLSLSLSAPNLSPDFSHFLIFFALIHLMPVWIYLFGVIGSFIKYKNTLYIITDKGVYSSGGTISKVYEHKSFGEISVIETKRGVIDCLLGVGDIVFSYKCTRYNKKNKYSDFDNIIICDIKEYKEVCQTAKDIQNEYVFKYKKTQ